MMDEPLLVNGIDNIGNTCYLNSALQCIANIGPFVAAFRRIVTLRPHVAGRVETESSGYRNRLIQTFTQVLKELEQSETSVRPRDLLRYAGELNPTFQSFQQADAPEFMLTLLSSIDDELHSKVVIQQLVDEHPELKSEEPYKTLLEVEKERNDREKIVAVRNKKPIPAAQKVYLFRSVVTDFFQGIMQSTTTCPNCKALSHNAEPFITLELYIPTKKVTPPAKASPGLLSRFCSTVSSVVTAPLSYMIGEDESECVHLMECFASHCAEENMTGGNKITCDHCGDSVLARRTLTFVHLPEVLIVHLKRFRHGYWSRKIKRFVECPLEIDLAPHVAALGGSAPSDDSQAGHTTYQLDSVVNHHGEMGGGHYTAYVSKMLKPGDPHEWILCNDDRIGKAREAVVLDSEVYVAVYRRKISKERSAGLNMTTTVEAARKILTRSVPIVGSLGGRFISVSWLVRAAWHSEPGPITNKACYCDEKRPHNHGKVTEAYVEVSPEEWDMFHSKYGGGPIVDLQEFEKMVVGEMGTRPAGQSQEDLE
eukprot:PhF_6_TR16997/c0_g1_i1/m.25722/K11848/USP20_33; ubiquitin carboxyl-terminal hydrolase 20/33